MNAGLFEVDHATLDVDLGRNRTWSRRFDPSSTAVNRSAPSARLLAIFQWLIDQIDRGRRLQDGLAGLNLRTTGARFGRLVQQGGSGPLTTIDIPAFVAWLVKISILLFHLFVYIKFSLYFLDYQMMIGMIGTLILLPGLLLGLKIIMVSLTTVVKSRKP